MKKGKEYFSNHKKILSFLIVLIVLAFSIFYAVLTERSRPSSEEESSQIKYSKGDQVPYKGSVFPGSSTLEDVKAKLGSPQKEEQKDGITIYNYKTDNPYLFNQVHVNNGIVESVKEPIGYNSGKKSDDILKEYGSPSYKLYNSSNLQDTYNLYVYPEKGLAFEGHPDGTVLKIWYFKQTDINSFIKSLAPNYSLTAPDGTNQQY